MAKILITGGSGLLGEAIAQRLVKRNEDFAILTRKGTHPQYPAFAWDPYSGMLDIKALDGLETIIHLAGAGIADKRWTKARRQEIIDSRVKTSEILLQKCKETGVFPKQFISASGINYYGIETTNRIFVENDLVGNDFTAQVVKVWEESADLWLEHSRVVKLRISVVLAKEGGALERMTPVTKKGQAAPLGNGKQWMPWIHLEDVAAMFLFAMDQPISGSFNAVADEHVTNRVFMKTLAKVHRRPMFLPSVPSFILYLMFGKLAELVLKGNRASNAKIKSAGFKFRFSKLEEALRDIYPKKD